MDIYGLRSIRCIRVEFFLNPVDDVSVIIRPRFIVFAVHSKVAYFQNLSSVVIKMNGYGEVFEQFDFIDAVIESNDDRLGHFDMGVEFVGRFEVFHCI